MMDYKYHVDVCEHISNFDRTISIKYNSFEAAYQYFTMNVDILRKGLNTDSWEVTLYDMEAMVVKFYITNIDFE